MNKQKGRIQKWFLKLFLALLPSLVVIPFYESFFFYRGRGEMVLTDLILPYSLFLLAVILYVVPINYLLPKTKVLLIILFSVSVYFMMMIIQFGLVNKGFALRFPDANEEEQRYLFNIITVLMTTVFLFTIDLYVWKKKTHDELNKKRNPNIIDD